MFVLLAFSNCLIHFLQMDKNQQPQDRKVRMEERILGLSRDELMIALKKRKGYEPEAEVIIVKEAIRRGLIHSENDLDLPEFNPRPGRFTLFPVPESEILRKKIINSMMRSLMIPGVMPIYFGIMKFGIPKYPEGAGLICSGLIWILMALVVMLKSERRLLFPMFLLLLLSMVYGGRIMLAYSYLRWTDIFIPAVLYLFAFYSLFYTNSLLRGKQRETPKE
jgi:hypothetical protein